MSKKVLQIMSAVEIAAAIALYFLLDYEYANNAYFISVAGLRNGEAKLYAILLYAIPAVHLIAGLLATLFNSAKKLMILMAVLILLTSLLHIFVIVTDYSLLRTITTVVLGTIYLIAASGIRKNQ